ncbi:ribonuclease H-like domain-containing protein [Tanacetum coccineum]
MMNPMDIKSKLGSDGDPVSDATLYRSLAGALQYLTFTRPYISYFVEQLHVSSTTQLTAYTVTLSQSSAEAEYWGVANVVAETAYAVYLSINPIQRQRTKHIQTNIHFVHDFVASGQVHVLHLPSRYQYANIFIKGLSRALFLEFPFSLNVRRPLVPTAGLY